LVGLLCLVCWGSVLTFSQRLILFRLGLTRAAATEEQVAHAGDVQRVLETQLATEKQLSEQALERMNKQVTTLTAAVTQSTQDLAVSFCFI
jgi:hypothetical protein